MLGAFTSGMGRGREDEAEDRAAWIDVRGEGMHRFVERRVLGFGAKLGTVLGAWNTLVGGTFMNYDARRLAFEGAYYVMGSLVLSGVGAMLEWSYLERKFGQVSAQNWKQSNSRQRDR